MEVIKPEAMQGQKNRRGITAKQLLKKESAQVNQLHLEPGDEIPPHAVPVDVFFYVVAGEGTLCIGDQEAVVKQGELIPCPRGVDMSLQADQHEEFVVLNVKTPSL